MPPIIITTRTICSEASPEYAMRVVEYMRKRGFDVEYGGTGPTPDDSLMDCDADPEWCKAFYEAIDRTFTERMSRDHS